MSRPGPIPMPTTKLRLTSPRHAKQREKFEPKPGSLGRAPPCPRYLSTDERKVWKWLVGELREMGLLSTADGKLLERYCVAYVRWRQASDFLRENGFKYPIKSKKGVVTSIAQFPEVVIARNEAKAMLDMEQNLGLSPSARARLGIDRVAAARGVEDAGAFFTAG